MSAQDFRVRYAAYSLDLLLLSPLLALAAWRPGLRAMAAHAELQAAAEAAIERAFMEGHFALLSLAAALREDAVFREALATGTAGIAAGVLGALLAAVAVSAFWFIGFEASPWQASPGKRAFGLRVVRVEGGRVPLARLLLRFLAAGPSWLLLHLGHALVLFRADGRAFHDLVAGTRVEGGHWPRWAGVWLGLQGLAVCALLSWVGWVFLQAMLVLGL
ncbi:MAG: hypothetical protein KatS3mg127_1106 [Silanimonas sp.]|nr:MAG: hypothetical protein KatS3mg127_1106 [Silanimonas sp.]